MKRLIYTALSILIVIVAVLIAIFSRDSLNQITNDIPQNNISGEVDSETKDLEKITVSEVTHSIFYAPQYVALNLGFFEEEGLEIELINGGGADNVMTAVLSNQVDIGFAGPEAAIYVYNEGKEDYAEVFAQVTKR